MINSLVTCLYSLHCRSIQVPAVPTVWPQRNLSPAVSPQLRHCHHYWAKPRPHYQVGNGVHRSSGHLHLLRNWSEFYVSETDFLLIVFINWTVDVFYDATTAKWVEVKMMTSCSHSQSPTLMTVASRVRGTRRERVFPHSMSHSSAFSRYSYVSCSQENTTNDCTLLQWWLKWVSKLNTRTPIHDFGYDTHPPDVSFGHIFPAIRSVSGKWQLQSDWVDEKNWLLVSPNDYSVDF